MESDHTTDKPLLYEFDERRLDGSKALRFPTVASVVRDEARRLNRGFNTFTGEEALDLFEAQAVRLIPRGLEPLGTETTLSYLFPFLATSRRSEGLDPQEFNLFFFSENEVPTTFAGTVELKDETRKALDLLIQRGIVAENMRKDQNGRLLFPDRYIATMSKTTIDLLLDYCAIKAPQSFPVLVDRMGHRMEHLYAIYTREARHFAIYPISAYCGIFTHMAEIYRRQLNGASVLIERRPEQPVLAHQPTAPKPKEESQPQSNGHKKKDTTYWWMKED